MWVIMNTEMMVLKFQRNLTSSVSVVYLLHDVCFLDNNSNNYGEDNEVSGNTFKWYCI